jgi:hypothetical protein
MAKTQRKRVQEDKDKFMLTHSSQLMSMNGHFDSSSGKRCETRCQFPREGEPVFEHCVSSFFIVV